ncbi:MAG: PAS domain-containing protein [Candidatus Thermoplasmatota archaeon]
MASDAAQSRAEDEIENIKRRYELILQSAGDGIFGIDSDGRITFVNPAAAKMLGFSSAELIGNDHHETFHAKRADGSPLAREDSPILATIRDGAAHHVRGGEVFWARGDRPIPIEYVSAPIREGGKVTGATIIFKNNEERRVASMPRPLVRRIVQDLVETGGVAHQVLQQVGRKLASDTQAADLDSYVRAYGEMGLGDLKLERSEEGRFTFVGSDLLENRAGSRVATCYFTLGFLGEAVSRVREGEPTLGTEIECQSRGSHRCKFIVQARKPEEGLARRVKELV